MKKNPLVSIITPSYNQGEYIEQTIKSVVNQTYQNFEHIIVDDGSTDETIKILKKYKAKYSTKIRWISQENRGQANAINKGLKMAKGNILGWLNSDDYYVNNTIEIVVDFFNNHPQAKWMSGDYFIVDKDNKLIQKYVVIYKRFLKLFPLKTMLYIANYIAQPSTFFKREIVQGIGYFDETLRYEMDYDYWLRIIKKHPLYLIQNPLSYFRIHNKSKGGSQFEKEFAEEVEVLKKYTDNKMLTKLHKLHSKLIVLIYKIIKSDL